MAATDDNSDDLFVVEPQATTMRIDSTHTDTQQPPFYPQGFSLFDSSILEIYLLFFFIFFVCVSTCFYTVSGMKFCAIYMIIYKHSACVGRVFRNKSVCI